MDTSSSSDAATSGLVAGIVMLYGIIGIFALAVMAFMIWLYWKVLQKAGMNGALALLNLVPFGNMIIMIMLAFGRWPIEDQLAAALGGGHPAPPQPPPSPLPGSSVMPS